MFFGQVTHQSSMPVHVRYNMNNSAGESDIINTTFLRWIDLSLICRWLRIILSFVNVLNLAIRR